MIREASYYRSLDQGSVVCELCPALCSLRPGQIGICGSRYNESGKLLTDNYGELVTVGIDPIEKKPLYHFFPGAKILSTGTSGCNFGCLNCQNWQISQNKQPSTYSSPESLVYMAKEHDALGVAFTYTEPMIWYEYIRDTAPLLNEAGLKVVLVSNGYISKEPLDDLLPFLDAVNIDLKSTRPDFYKKICKGKLEPVMENIERFYRADVHLEVTNLIIPGHNDTDEDFKAVADFIGGISPEIPLHFSAFHPDYKLAAVPTAVETMIRARDTALKQLRFVYIGNMVVEGTADTKCPDCGAVLVSRENYRIKIVELEGGNCARCGAESGIIC